MTRDIDAILEDLSYSMASPEAKSIYQDIQDKEYEEASKSLSKYLDQDEIECVIEHFKKKNNQTYVLTEIKLEDIDLMDFKQVYLFKVGEVLAQSCIYDSFRAQNEKDFYSQHQPYFLSQAQQIWKIKTE